MAAGLATLKTLKENPDIYAKINEMGAYLAGELRRVSGLTVNNVGSLLCLYYTDKPVRNYADAVKSNTDRFSGSFGKLLEKGIYVAPSQFEAMFLNACFTGEDLDYTVRVYEEIFEKEK